MTSESDLLRHCESEPLAHSGLVQAHGALLYLDKRSQTFQFVSSNVDALLGEEPRQLLGQDGKDWLEQNLPDLTALPSPAGRRWQQLAAVDLGSGDLDVLVSATSGGWIIEFEPALDAVTSSLGAIQLPKPEGPLNTETIQAMQQVLVEMIAATTGYERVMLYQFQPDWSGEVLAESAHETIGSYLGLRFPASDIPAIARNLYAQTPYRHIPDAAAQPIALLADQGNSTELDLTWSDLRSVSPVHAEYLANMQVASSFSVSVMVDGKLWGLVACHHRKPLMIPLAAREHAKALVNEFVQIYSDYRNRVRRDLYAALEQAILPIRAAAQSAQDFGRDSVQNSGQDSGQNLAAAVTDQQASLAALTGTKGGALWVGNTVYHWGVEADPDTLNAVHDWCLKNQSEPVFWLDNLPAHVDSTAELAEISGVLGLNLRSKQMNNALVSLYLFRPEEASEIAWAGNPNKPVEADSEGEQLSPRRSFAKWVEVRHGYSRAWDDDARFIGQNMRELLVNSL